MTSFNGSLSIAETAYSYCRWQS